MSKRAADILFWLVLALSTAVLAMLLLVVGGVVPVDDPPDRSAGVTESSPAPTPAARTTLRAETPKRTTTRPAPVAATTTTTTAAKAPSATLVVVTATRGDSWFSARLGSESGRVLDERVLAQGQSVHLRGERIWLTVGAAGNVDLTVNGKARDIQPGTVELVLPRPASAASYRPASAAS